MGNVLTFLMLLCVAALLVGVAALIRPMPRIGLKTRGRALLAVIVAFVGFMAIGAVNPDMQNAGSEPAQEGTQTEAASSSDDAIASTSDGSPSADVHPVSAESSDPPPFRTAQECRSGSEAYFQRCNANVLEGVNAGSLTGSTIREAYKACSDALHTEFEVCNRMPE